MFAGRDDWKDEEVHDYKFSYIDVDEFRIQEFYPRLKYALVYVSILRGILIYMADIFTVIQYLVFNSFDNNPGVLKLKHQYGRDAARWMDTLKWVYLGSIFFSLFLLLLEARRCRQIIKSNFISYAFTSSMAYQCYAITSYSHYCFFLHIEDFKTRIDNLAYFVYFNLRGTMSFCFCSLPCPNSSCFSRLFRLQARVFWPVAASCDRFVLSGKYLGRVWRQRTRVSLYERVVEKPFNGRVPGWQICPPML
jgi:hypothetical protein